ncbi:MAG: DUF1428 family protein [Limisphaerales bacterium]
MSQYIDGFVLSVPKNKLAAYKKMATKASKVWLDHGALEYRECVGDDMTAPGMVAFPNWQSPNPMKSSSSPTSSSNRANTATRPTRKSSPTRASPPVRSQRHALRLQAHGIRRLQNTRRRLKCMKHDCPQRLTM